MLHLIETACFGLPDGLLFTYSFHSVVVIFSYSYTLVRSFTSHSERVWRMCVRMYIILRRTAIPALFPSQFRDPLTHLIKLVRSVSEGSSKQLF